MPLDLSGPGEADFFLPGEVLVHFQANSQEAFRVCPLGTLYLSAVYAYALMAQGAPAEAQIRHSEELSTMLRAFPILVVAGSRWPVYEALHHFGGFHGPASEGSEALLCKERGAASGIHWRQLLEHAVQWSKQGILGLEPGQGSQEHTLVLKTVMDALVAEPQRISDAAQDECPLGFLFLCVVQMTAASTRLTGTVHNWAESVDKLLADVPYFMVSGSQWPIYQQLGTLSAMFQRPEYSLALGRQFHGEVHRWGGTHPMAKRFRAFGDLRLLPEELMPFGRLVCVRVWGLTHLNFFGFPGVDLGVCHVICTEYAEVRRGGAVTDRGSLHCQPGGVAPCHRGVEPRGEVSADFPQSDRDHYAGSPGFTAATGHRVWLLWHRAPRLFGQRLSLGRARRTYMPSEAGQAQGALDHLHVGPALVSHDSVFRGVDAQAPAANHGGGHGPGLSRGL